MTLAEALTALAKTVAGLRAEIATLSKRPGPRGERGEPGPAGSSVEIGPQEYADLTDDYTRGRVRVRNLIVDGEVIRVLELS